MELPYGGGRPLSHLASDQLSKACLGSLLNAGTKKTRRYFRMAVRLRTPCLLLYLAASSSVDPLEILLDFLLSIAWVILFIPRSEERRKPLSFYAAYERSEHFGYHARLACPKVFHHSSIKRFDCCCLIKSSKKKYQISATAPSQSAAFPFFCPQPHLILSKMPNK